MIYLISFICGTLNGLFAAAAGQVLIFYLIYILKMKAHEARGTSILCMSIITIISLIGYFKIVKFKIINVIIITICGLIFGYIGSKTMEKIKSNYLNLISGIIIVLLSAYKLFVK